MPRLVQLKLYQIEIYLTNSLIFKSKLRHIIFLCNLLNYGNYAGIWSNKWSPSTQGSRWYDFDDMREIYIFCLLLKSILFSQK